MVLGLGEIRLTLFTLPQPYFRARNGLILQPYLRFDSINVGYFRYVVQVGGMRPPPQLRRARFRAGGHE